MSLFGITKASFFEPSVPNEVSVVKTSATDRPSRWQPFSVEALQALRQSGKPVFVDFTAKWCLICQTNKMALHSPEVTAAFDQSGVVTLEADWTKKNPHITEALHAVGRSGVPVYVLYPADPQAAPILLPQTLTKQIVLDYLHKLQ